MNPVCGKADQNREVADRPDDRAKASLHSGVLEKMPRKLSGKGVMMPLPQLPSNQKWQARSVDATAFSWTFKSKAGRLSNPARLQMRSSTDYRPIPKRMMGPSFSRVALTASCTLLFAYSSPIPMLGEEKSTGTKDYELEELGVNPFTAPSVADIFQQLDDLKPLPFEQLKREFPAGTRSGREQMGLVFGGLVADGFLIVECQKQNLVEELGRVLLRQAHSLGVGDRVMRHSASLMEHGKRGDWTAVRRELISTQDDVEQAMTALRDQKMAHLISLGGWLRGLEIASGAVESRYSPERAAVLWQRDLINYFAEEIKTLPPSTARSPLFEKLRVGVDTLRNLLNHAPPDKMSLSEVKALHAKARELNLIVLAGE